MEESELIDGPSADAIRSGAMEDMASADLALASTIADIIAEVRADLDAAESDAALVYDQIAGEAATLLDDATAPVGKYLQTVESAAWDDYGAAMSGLFREGITPLSDFPSILADFDQDNPRQTALNALAGAVSTPITDQPIGEIPPPGEPPSPVVPGKICYESYNGEPPFPPPAGMEWVCVTEEAGICLGYCLQRIGTSPTVPPTVSPTIPTTPPEEPSCPTSCPTPVVTVTVGGVSSCLPVSPPTVPPASPPTVPPGSGSGSGRPEPEPTSPPSSPPSPPLGGSGSPPPRVPPPPPPPSWRPTPPTGVPVIQSRVDHWDGPERCASLTQSVGLGVTDARAAANAATAQIRAQADAADRQLSSVVASLFGGQPPSWLTGFTPAGDAAGAYRDQLATSLMSAAPDVGAVGVEAAAVIAGATWTERVTGAPTGYLTEGYRYDLQYAAPQYLPSQEQVDEMRLSNVIDDSLWECLTRANGNKVWARKLVLRARRNRPNLSQWVSLWRKGRLTSRELGARASESGVTDQGELEAVIADSEFVPPYTDLTRMMVRDSADEEISRAFAYDTDFEQKFRGPIREWARAQGIDETVFRYLWRAHWQLPSPTQLYEMLRRLRPGRVPQNLAVDEELVRKTLQANDIAPAFVERLMEVSYNVITRTDLLSFYTNGSMERPEVIERLEDAGYNRADAVRIVDAWELEVANRRANRSRVWTRSNITKRLINGSLDIAAARDLLSRTIADPAEVQLVINDCLLMQQSIRREKCVKAVRRKRLVGELDTNTAIRELQDLGVDAAVAVDLANGWECEIVSMSKEPALGMLRDWLQRGFIDPDELYRRLRNLRYTEADAERIAADMVLDEQERRAKLVAQAAERAERIRKQNIREARAEARRAVTNRERVARGKEPLP